MRLVLMLVLTLLWPLAAAAEAKKTLLAVFAHPDDETVLGEVLLKYARMGWDVRVVIATDGRNGTRVTKIPAGEQLGNLRKEESRCAMRKLGVAPPIFLGIERLDTQIGTPNYFRAHREFLERLKLQVETLDPDVIVTFGPDGDTTHAEHIVTGAGVTELLLREGWVERYPLYYVAWTQAQAAAGELGYVHERYFNVSIAYSQADEDRALEMMPCYETQYTPEEIAEDRRSKLADRGNVLHLRRFAVHAGKADGF